MYSAGLKCYFEIILWDQIKALETDTIGIYTAGENFSCNLHEEASP